MYSRYVVGVDGSRPSIAALDWAATRARLDGAPLVLAHVEEPEAGMMGQDFAEQELRTGAAILAELTAGVAERGLDVESVLLNGTVPWALTEFTGPDDLLVVGTHKTGFLHGRVLGSRSVAIATTARCSVAVIPAVDVRFRRGVVVGVDEAADAGEIACAAAAEAADRGDHLSVIRSLTGPAATTGQLHDSDAVEAVRRAFPDLIVRTRESRRGPAEALLDASRDKALLVIGPGAGDRLRSPIGSVLHDVLLNLNAPALISRRPGERR